jgi:hypothetical protein
MRTEVGERVPRQGLLGRRVRIRRGCLNVRGSAVTTIERWVSEARDSSRRSRSSDWDLFHGALPDDAEMYITVKEVVWTEEAAEAEVDRLNALNAGKGCRYFLQYTRAHRRDADGGSNSLGAT